MRKQIIADLLREYAQVRADAESKAATRHDEIVAKVPIYGYLQLELARIMSACAQSGEDATLKVKALRAKAENDLRAAGYTPEDLSPPYRCALCRDTGYVGEPIKRFCTCFEHKLKERVIERSGLGSAPGHTFSHFDLEVFAQDDIGAPSQRETMRRLQNFAKDWAERFPDNAKRDLVLTGPTGLGKTFLIDCIADRVIQRGFTVLRMTAFRLLQALRLHHRGQDTEGLLEVMLSVDLLLIDDLGTEPLIENVSIEYLFTVLNERQQARKSTLVATNLSLGELRARYSERITSRLLNAECAVVLRLEGKDVRLRRDNA